MRDFPITFEESKPISMYPSHMETITGDVLEIGPGRGDLLFSLAAAHPAKKFVAIEIGYPRYQKLVENTKRKAFGNIHLVRADARVALKRYFEPNTFEQIFVLFPDPWPKNKHAFRRLLSVEWISLLVQFLKPGGELVCATDVPDYANWVFDNLSQFTTLTNTLAPSKYLSEINNLPETYFQKKWKSLGLNLFFMVHKKTTS